jgi:hypothetical protein
MVLYQRMKDYLKDNWGDYVAVGGLAAAIIASANFALDGNKIKHALEREIEKEKAKQVRRIDMKEMEK